MWINFRLFIVWGRTVAPLVKSRTNCPPSFIPAFFAVDMSQNDYTCALLPLIAAPKTLPYTFCSPFDILYPKLLFRIFN